MKLEKHVIGSILLLISIAIFSTLEIASKELRQTTAEISSYCLVFLRFAVTGLVLAIWGYIGFHKEKRILNWKDWRNFSINGLVGIALSIFLFHKAIDVFAQASSAAVVFSANALFAVILAKFLNHEPWNVVKWLAVCIGMLGISLFVFETGVPEKNALCAIGIMSLSSFCFAFSVCFTKRVVNRYGALFFMGMSSVVGALLIMPFAVMSLPANVSAVFAVSWRALLYIVLVGTLLAYSLYYLGIKYSSVFMASMCFLLKPVLACFFAWLWNGDVMNVWTFSGMIGIVFALALTAYCQLAGRQSEVLS